jgi:NAD+ synthase
MNAAQVANHITDWLRSYNRDSGTKGFVVGVSGGIDSAVTSALCAATLEPVLLLELPIHQGEAQVTRAAEHIRKLEEQFSHVSHIRVDLTDTYESIKKDLVEVENDDMALVNTRARLRMTTLYYYAGAKAMLVAGTGNKVEDFGIGFFTKYGDGGVDLSPIADLTKTEVYELGKELGVIEDIMVAPPTDGLWGDDRTDEDQIGASYPELEWAMEQDAGGKSVGDFEGREAEVMKIYVSLNRANLHKMNPIPVCVIPEAMRS